jgi:hypothetical protein
VHNAQGRGRPFFIYCSRYRYSIGYKTYKKLFTVQIPVLRASPTARSKQTVAVRFGPILIGIEKNSAQWPDAFSSHSPRRRKCGPNLGAVCIVAD